MSRERNLVHSIEEIPKDSFCPKCKSLDISRASANKQKNTSVTNYMIDIFSDKWLECGECGTVWRKQDKKETDEDRERDREDESL